jgi:hypothetical protein
MSATAKEFREVRDQMEAAEGAAGNYELVLAINALTSAVLLLVQPDTEADAADFIYARHAAGMMSNDTLKENTEA